MSHDTKDILILLDKTNEKRNKPTVEDSPIELKPIEIKSLKDITKQLSEIVKVNKQALAKSPESVESIKKELLLIAEVLNQKPESINLQPIVEALSKTVVPVTYKFDVVRNMNGFIQSIVATPQQE